MANFLKTMFLVLIGFQLISCAKFSPKEGATSAGTVATSGTSDNEFAHQGGCKRHDSRMGEQCVLLYGNGMELWDTNWAERLCDQDHGTYLPSGCHGGSTSKCAVKGTFDWYTYSSDGVEENEELCAYYKAMGKETTFTR